MKLREKTCTRCTQERPLEEFARKGQRRSSWCKPCHRQIAKDHYVANKDVYRVRNARVRKRKAAFLRSLKQVPCADCGGRFPHYVMEFDHVRKKRYSVGQTRSHSWRVLREELEKCELVCANCHRVRTWRRRQQFRRRA